MKCTPSNSSKRATSFACYNLGNLYNQLDRPEDAISQYEAAIGIDHQFIPAKANLALLYNQKGQNARAEQLLREIAESLKSLRAGGK